MSLLKRTSRESYQMHRLLRSFFQLKMQDVTEAKKAVHEALLDICRKIPERCNQVEANNFTPVEPHVIAAIDAGMHDHELYQSLQCYFVGKGLYHQAHSWANEALERYQQSANGDTQHLARLHKQVGERAHLSAMYGIALKNLQKAHALLQGEPPSKLLAEVLVILSATLRAVSSNEEAEAMSHDALELCQQFFKADSLEMAEARLTQATAKFTRLRDHNPSVSANQFAQLEKDVQTVIKRFVSNKAPMTVAALQNPITYRPRYWSRHPEQRKRLRSTGRRLNSQVHPTLMQLVPAITWPK